MSQQELEQTDQEVMNMVNSHSAPESVAAADEIENRWHQRQKGSEKQDPAESLQETNEQLRMQFARYQRRKLTVSICLCVLVVALLLVAIFVPSAVVWVANLGILCCGMVAAVIVDRYRWGREYEF